MEQQCSYLTEFCINYFDNIYVINITIKVNNLELHLMKKEEDSRLYFKEARRRWFLSFKENKRLLFNKGIIFLPKFLS